MEGGIVKENAFFLTSFDEREYKERVNSRALQYKRAFVEEKALTIAQVRVVNKGIAVEIVEMAKENACFCLLSMGGEYNGRVKERTTQ